MEKKLEYPPPRPWAQSIVVEEGANQNLDITSAWTFIEGFLDKSKGFCAIMISTKIQCIVTY